MNARQPKTVEMPEWFRFMRRMVRATSRRVADRDIEALAGLAMLRDEVDQAIQDAVDHLRTEDGGGYSWTDVGRVLGTTRQAAQQKYGKRGAA